MPENKSSILPRWMSRLRPRRRYFRKYSWLPDVLRIKGSIFWGVLGPVLTVTIFATAVAFAYEKGYDVTLTNSVTPLLAVVVGLILVFRNTTSYDRYYEGRKCFGTTMACIRNLSRLTWVNVLVIPESQAHGAPSFRPPKCTRYQVKLQKMRMLKLLVSFAIAVKHHLREEYETDYDDFIDVLPIDLFGKRREPIYASGTLTGASTAKSSVSNLNNHLPAREDSPLLGDSSSRVEFHRYVDDKQYAFPLIILHEYTRMLSQVMHQGVLTGVGPAGLNGMNQLAQSMVEQFTAMERISNTPIPSSYGIHLKQCVTLYLFALPFTLVKDLRWRMIPIVTVVAFTLMGIEGIANSIEMPFGTDYCDLPLDKYCAELRAEVEYIIDAMPEGYDDDWYRD